MAHIHTADGKEEDYKNFFFSVRFTRRGHSDPFAAVAPRKPQAICQSSFRKMDFLHEKFNMVKAAPGPTDTFFAEDVRK